MTQDEIIHSPLGRDQIIDLAREAGFTEIEATALEYFYQAAFEAGAAHEREKWEPAFSKNKPAPKIENGNVYFEAGLYTPLEVQLAIDILEEREACAKVCDDLKEIHCTLPEDCAAAIRLRSNKH